MEFHLVHIVLLLLPLATYAQLEVRLLETQQSGNKSLVKLELNGGLWGSEIDATCLLGRSPEHYNWVNSLGST